MAAISESNDDDQSNVIISLRRPSRYGGGDGGGGITKTKTREIRVRDSVGLIFFLLFFISLAPGLGHVRRPPRLRYTWRHHRRVALALYRGRGKRI